MIIYKSFGGINVVSRDVSVNISGQEEIFAQRESKTIVFNRYAPFEIAKKCGAWWVSQSGISTSRLKSRIVVLIHRAGCLQGASNCRGFAQGLAWIVGDGKRPASSRRTFISALLNVMSVLYTCIKKLFKSNKIQFYTTATRFTLSTLSILVCNFACSLAFNWSNTHTLFSNSCPDFRDSACSRMLSCSTGLFIQTYKTKTTLFTIKNCLILRGT